MLDDPSHRADINIRQVSSAINGSKYISVYTDLLTLKI